MAASWTETPDLIVTSPYLRTQQTAAATIERFPNVPVEVWPIQEFTYLQPSRWNGTLSSERMPHIERYWAAADPEFYDGDGAESFTTMLRRVRASRAKQIEQEVAAGLGRFRDKFAAWREGSPKKEFVPSRSPEQAQSPARDPSRRQDQEHDGRSAFRNRFEQWKDEKAAAEKQQLERELERERALQQKQKELQRSRVEALAIRRQRHGRQ